MTSAPEQRIKSTLEPPRGQLELRNPFKKYSDAFIEAAAEGEVQNVDELTNAFKYIDNVSDASDSWSSSLGRAGDLFSFTLATAKTLHAYQKDQHTQIKRGTHTAIKEYSKWGVGTLVGGFVAGVVMTISATNPLTAAMVATFAAWGSTTVVENSIDRIATTYFDPLNDTKVSGPLDPQMVQWLGVRTKDGLTLDIQTKHLEVRPTFIPDSMLPSQAVHILRTAQENCIARAGDLLGVKPTPFGPMKHGKPTSLGELENQIPSDITTEEQLYDFVKKRAQKRVRDGKGDSTGEPTRQGQYEAYLNRAYPYIQRAWLERRNKLERLLQKLKLHIEMCDPHLVVSPENPEIDPVTGKAVIHFTLEEKEISDTLAKVRRVERLLTGKAPTATCNVRWTAKSKQHGKVDQTAPWPKGAKWWTSVIKPGMVTFGYKVTIAANYPPGSTLEMVSTDDMILIEVTGEEVVTRVFEATKMDDEHIGKLRMTIKGTMFEGVTDTRLSPPDRSGELREPKDVGDIPRNASIIIMEALRGLRNVVKYKGTFDPATSTLRGTTTLQTGMKDGPLKPDGSGTFKGTLRGNVLTITYSFPPKKQGDKPWSKTFSIREKPPAKQPDDQPVKQPVKQPAPTPR